MLCLCGLSVIIAARVRSFAEGTLLTDTLGAGLIFFAPVFYKADALPHFISTVTQWLPTSCAARAVQASLTGNSHDAIDLVALCVATLLIMTLAFRVMKWQET
jgi:ABC-type multidrug transport system permease subunit